MKVVTNQTCSDDMQAQAAGMAEGYITSEFIYMDYLNRIVDYCTNEKILCQNLAKFIDENNSWKDDQIKQSQDSEKAYWHQVWRL